MRIKDDQKVDRIFKACLKLIHKIGIAGITMAKIAKESGLATGTLYIYFENKEELINQLYLTLRKATTSRFMEGVDSQNSIKLKIRKTWMNYLKNRIEFNEESVFLEQYYRSPFTPKKHTELSEEMKNPVKKIIRDGQKEGIIKADLDDEMVFLSMLGFIRELADEHVSGAYKLNQEKIEKAFNLNWGAIKA